MVFRGYLDRLYPPAPAPNSLETVRFVRSDPKNTLSTSPNHPNTKKVDFRKNTKLKMLVVCEHFDRLYPRAPGSNPLEIARFVLFRECRIGLKKIRVKNFAGARRSGLLHFIQIYTPKSSFCLTSFVGPLI